MANVYDQGDLVRVAAVFTDENDAAFDPDVVTFEFRTPAGTVTTKSYPTDAEVVKDAVGTYHMDIDTDVVNADGHWMWRAYGKTSGNISQGSDETSFIVQGSVF